jgi:stress response protein YsnF
MATRRRPEVVDRDGKRGWLRGVDAVDPRHPLAVIELTTGEHLRIPFDVLEHHDDGGYTTSARWSEYPQVYRDGASIPVIEERVNVAVRPAPAEQVRVHRRVVTEQAAVEVPLTTERVEVDHVPVNQFVDHVPRSRQEGDTLIIPVVEEVIEIRLRVREELHVRVVRERAVHRESVLIRRHEVDVARTTSTHPPISHHDEGEEA